MSPDKMRVLLFGQETLDISKISACFLSCHADCGCGNSFGRTVGWNTRSGGDHLCVVMVMVDCDHRQVVSLDICSWPGQSRVLKGKRRQRLQATTHKETITKL